MKESQEIDTQPYGLPAGIWTKNLTLAHETARGLRAGFGRELGKAALDRYTEQKAVWVGLQGL